MAPIPPVVIGMTICRDVLREPSGNYSIIRSFTRQPVDEFPGIGEPFSAFVVLTDAVGEAEAKLVVTWFGESEIGEYARGEHL